MNVFQVPPFAPTGSLPSGAVVFWMSRRRGSAGQGRNRALQRSRFWKDTGRRACKDVEQLRRLTPPQEGFELDAGKEFQAVR